MFSSRPLCLSWGRQVCHTQASRPVPPSLGGSVIKRAPRWKVR
jgi:hypothetical protein